MNMSTPAPSQKVTASALAMSATTIAIWFVNHYLLKADPIPAEVGALLTTLVGSLVAYFVKPSASDVAVSEER